MSEEIGVTMVMEQTKYWLHDVNLKWGTPDTTKNILQGLKEGLNTPTNLLLTWGRTPHWFSSTEHVDIIIEHILKACASRGVNKISKKEWESSQIVHSS